jgi:hypothetical protein
LETGQSYYILFTTSGGLYRYNINDIVKVVGWHHSVPLLEFLHKGGNISSFTGEKVTESQVTEAASATLSRTGMAVRFFTVVPEFSPEPHYEVWVEFEQSSMPNESDSSAGAQSLIKKIAGEFDRQLGRANIEYQAKRDSHRLAPATGRVLPCGTYDNLRRQLVAQGVPDAQIKVSHLNPKEEVRRLLEAPLAVPHSAQLARSLPRS